MSLPEESVAANTLPEVTTIPTGKKLIFTDPDTNEGGIITLENLSKQILQNLTSQTFALDHGNLTLLQALNQLNSKTLAPRGNITESLDNYKTTDGTHLPGVYLINGHDVFGDGKNKWGILILFQYINLQLMIIEGGNIYSRDWSGNPLHWTNWKIFSNSNMA